MHKHASFSLFLSPWAALSKYLEMFAVYIDSLVMISIERSVTNKKRALKIRDKFVTDWAIDLALTQSVTDLSWIFSAFFFNL